MYARISTGPANLDRLDEAMQLQQHESATVRERQPGFRGNMIFANRQTGQVVAIGFWETEADLHASIPVHTAIVAAGVSDGHWAALPTTELYEVVGTFELK